MNLNLTESALDEGYHCDALMKLPKAILASSCTLVDFIALLAFGNSLDPGAQQENESKMQANFIPRKRRPSSLTNKDNQGSLSFLFCNNVFGLK